MRFQSSPAPKSGCNCATIWRCCGVKSCFNPHPLRRADAIKAMTASTVSVVFQSSPAPKSGCNRLFFFAGISRICFNPHPLRRADAIMSGIGAYRQTEFQSSPAPKSGCNVGPILDGLPTMKFQSSPAPKSGCNSLRLSRFSAMRCFNPHPLRRADAIVLLKAT